MCGILGRVPVKDVCQCQEGEVHVLTVEPNFIVGQELPHGLHCADHAAMRVDHTLGVTCRPWQQMQVKWCCLASYKPSHQQGCSCNHEDTLEITPHRCSAQWVLSADMPCACTACAVQR